jgi:predicted AAA+ superfamily ATPase
MKRIVEQQMLDWKESNRRKPLIIRGARQVGKTWLVENFLAREFENLAKIDFEERQDLHAHFSGNLDPKGILQSLEITTGKIVPGKTLLFLDEIQACPRAIMALRYFYEKLPELHVVAAGSLLEFAFDEISFPVGRVQYLHVRPMTFYEYLLAIGNQPMAELVLMPQDDVPETAQQMVLAELKKYFLVGGMPECVKVYRNSGSLLDAFAVQSEILDSFRDDFSKYKPPMDANCLDAVFGNAARSVGDQIKYTRLDEGHTGPTNRKAFDLLCKARIFHKVSACNPSGVPLAATVKEKKFKACFLDIGLMQRLCEVEVDVALTQDNLLAIYNGRLAEQFVAQEMLAWQEGGLYYWSREAKSSSAEVDYLVVRDGQVYPLEVKSGPGGRLKSLHLMLQAYPNCPEGLVLYSGSYRKLSEQKLIFMPLYSAAVIGDIRPVGT